MICAQARLAAASHALGRCRARSGEARTDTPANGRVDTGPRRSPSFTRARPGLVIAVRADGLLEDAAMENGRALADNCRIDFPWSTLSTV